MKKLNFDIVFKIIILISLAYSLILLTVIANNSTNGRFQGNVGSVIDTKTGTAYYFDNGTRKELKIIDLKGE